MQNLDVTPNHLKIKVKWQKNRKIAEFNYKILHNSLINNVYLCKWISTIKKECSYCNDSEDIIHMLYECEVNTDIWNALGKHINLSIKNKHIILDYGTDIIQEQFRHIKGTHVDFKNDCISTVAYIIYKYWLSSLNNERKKERRSLIKFSISELNYHSNISLFLGDKQKYGALYNTMNGLKKLLLHYDPG